MSVILLAFIYGLCGGCYQPALRALVGLGLLRDCDCDRGWDCDCMQDRGFTAQSALDGSSHEYSSQLLTGGTVQCGL